MKQRIFSVCGIVLALLGGVALSFQAARIQAIEWWLTGDPPEPAECYLCEHGAYAAAHHGPCVVNLATGRVAELDVYARKRLTDNELAEVQDLDYSVSHTSPAGPRVSVVRMPSLQAASVTLSPDERSGEMNPALYCLRCRGLLAGADTSGFVLADLYDLSRITAYPLRAGAFYTIREYTVTVEREGRFLTVTAAAALF